MTTWDPSADMVRAWWTAVVTVVLWTLLAASGEPRADTYSDLIALRELLVEERFEELDRRLREQRPSANDHPRSELWEMDAYGALIAGPSTWKGHLDDWVERMPDAYTARIARGLHQMREGERVVARDLKRGVQSYGGRKRMRKAFKSARADFKAALAIDPNLTAPFAGLMTMAAMERKPKQRDEITVRALTANPASYILRRSQLIGLEPRFGGTEDEVAKALRDINLHVAENPVLAGLNGHPSYVLAKKRQAEKDHGKAEALLSEALSHGELPDYFGARASVRMALHNFEAALEDFDRTLALQPGNSGALRGRAALTLRQGDERKARQLLDQALKLDPSSVKLVQIDGRSAFFEGDFVLASVQYDLAVFGGIDEFQLWYRRGVVNASDEVRRYDTAAVDFQRATERDPNYAVAWLRYGVVQRQLGSCQSIVNLKKYLRVCESGVECDSESQSWAKDAIESQVSDGKCHPDGRAKGIKPPGDPT